MTPTLKKLRIACHPDRHGGDESVMEDFYASLKKNIKGVRNTCKRCPAIISPLATYCRICYRRPRLIALVLIVFAGCAAPKPMAPAPTPRVATPPLPMTIIRQRAVEAPTLPATPPRLIEVAWDYPYPESVTFEVWATTNLMRPFALKTNTLATSVKFAKGTMEFYKVRARAADGAVSDWATTR